MNLNIPTHWVISLLNRFEGNSEAGEQPRQPGFRLMPLSLRSFLPNPAGPRSLVQRLQCELTTLAQPEEWPQDTSQMLDQIRPCQAPCRLTQIQSLGCRRYRHP